MGTLSPACRASDPWERRQVSFGQKKRPWMALEGRGRDQTGGASSGAASFGRPPLLEQHSRRLTLRPTLRAAGRLETRSRPCSFPRQRSLAPRPQPLSRSVVPAGPGRRLLVGQGLPSSSIVCLSLQIRRNSRHNLGVTPSKVNESTEYLELALPRHRDPPSTCGVTPGNSQELTRFSLS